MGRPSLSTAYPQEGKSNPKSSNPDPTSPNPCLADSIILEARQSATEFAEVGRRYGSQLLTGAVIGANVWAHAPLGGGATEVACTLPELTVAKDTKELAAWGQGTALGTASACGGAVGALLGKALGASVGAARGVAATMTDRFWTSSGEMDLFALQQSGNPAVDGMMKAGVAARPLMEAGQAAFHQTVAYFHDKICSYR